MWLSEKWIKKVMLGASGPRDSELPEDILKIRLAGMAYLPQGSSQPLPPAPEKAGLEPCPAFLRTAFNRSISQSDELQLKELLLICNRYSLLPPGESIPELYKIFHPDSMLQRQLLLTLHPHLLFLSDHFEEFRHFKKAGDPEWNDWTPLQRKAYLLSRFAWEGSLQPLYKITELPSEERSDLLQTFIYHEWPVRQAFAEEMSGSRSKKANAWVNAYLLKDPSHSLFQKAHSFVSDLFFYDNNELHFKGKVKPSFPIACPDIVNENTEHSIRLLGWMDPEILFTSMNIDPQDFSDQLSKLENRTAIVGAILHGAVYHNNQEWIEYGLEMVRYYHLEELTSHEKWHRLMKRIPAASILPVFHKAMGKAVSDLDRLDALYYWLYPADIFLSKEVSEKVWPAVATGTELLATGGLPLQKFKEFFNWIRNRIYPGFPAQWVMPEDKTGLIAQFQESIRKRHQFYKSLNSWLSKKQRI